MKIKIKDPGPFKLLYELPPDTDLVIVIGGRGGRKTYEVSKFAAYAATIRKKRVAVLRDEKETIRESILQEIFNRYDTANSGGHFEGIFEKSDRGIRDQRTGNMIVFTKGFRASSLEKKTNLKGVSDTDIAVVEEAEDIRSFQKFSTFKDSIRTQDRLIIVMLNTPDLQHWIVKRYFNIIQYEPANFIKGTTAQDYDGYYRLEPRTDIPGFACIQTSYLDNPFLPESIIRDYKAYGNPDSNTFDLHYYLTAILGLASAGRQGQVLKKVKPISLKDWLALDARTIYGQDFGTASPAGLIAVKNIKNNSYGREMNYKGMDELQLGRLYCTLKLDPSKDLILGDDAASASIGRLRRGWNKNELSDEDIKNFPNLLKGFNIRNAMKGRIEPGIAKMTGMGLYLTEDSKNGWEEVWNYTYAKDKNDILTDEPIDDFNHIIDPWRYVIDARGRVY